MIFYVSSIGYLMMTRSFLVNTMQSYFTAFLTFIIIGTPVATVEVVCFFTSMVGIFLFGIAPMSDDDMDILGSKEWDIYFDTRDLAKTSPEMIHKGGLSWPGITQILMGNIFPPKGTVPMDPDFQSLTLAIGLSLGLIATVFAGLGSVLATKLKNRNERMNK